MDAQLGQLEQFLPVLERAIAAKPQVAPIREAQLRTLRTLGKRDELRDAFERWRHDVPGDPTPAREYSRLLIADGDTRAADSVLRQAQQRCRLRARLRVRARAAPRGNGTLGSRPRNRGARRWRTTAISIRPRPSRSSPRPSTARAGHHQGAAGFAGHGVARGACSRRCSSCGARRATAGSRCACSRPTARRWSRGASSRRRPRRWSAWLVARDALAAAQHANPEPRALARAAYDALRGGDADRLALSRDARRAHARLRDRGGDDRPGASARAQPDRAAWPRRRR